MSYSNISIHKWLLRTAVVLLISTIVAMCNRAKCESDAEQAACIAAHQWQMQTTTYPLSLEEILQKEAEMEAQTNKLPKPPASKVPPPPTDAKPEWECIKAITLMGVLLNGGLLWYTQYLSKRKWQLHVFFLCLCVFLSHSTFALVAGQQLIPPMAMLGLELTMIVAFIRAAVASYSSSADHWQLWEEHHFMDICFICERKAKREQAEAAQAEAKARAQQAKVKAEAQAKSQSAQRKATGSTSGGEERILRRTRWQSSNSSGDGGANQQSTAAGGNSRNANRPSSGSGGSLNDAGADTYSSYSHGSSHDGTTGGPYYGHTGQSSGNGFSIGDAAGSVFVTPVGDNCYAGSDGSTYYSSNGSEFVNVHGSLYGTKSSSYDYGGYYGGGSSRGGGSGRGERSGSGGGGRSRAGFGVARDGGLSAITGGKRWARMMSQNIPRGRRSRW